MSDVEYNIGWWNIDFGETAVSQVSDAIRSRKMSMGSVTRSLEMDLERRLGVSHVVMTTSGSTALFMALKALGVGPGDEVIVPDRTWIATAHAVQMTGADVVLVDVLKDVPIMDVDLVADKITDNTRAIMPVHLNGRSVDMKALHIIARKYNIHLIEDAAQGLFSVNDSGYLGTQSAAGCFSLSISKLISTAQGGFVVTNDDGIYHSLNRIRTHGVTDLVNTTYNGWGFNFRYTDILAAIGLGQLEVIDQTIHRIKDIYFRYYEGMKGLTRVRLIESHPDSGELPIYIEVLCDARDELVAFLKERKVQVRPFYPSLNGADHIGGDGCFDRSERFSAQGLFLPSGPAQSDADIEFVIGALHDFE